jgi:hypothetical protein
MILQDCQLKANNYSHLPTSVDVNESGHMLHRNASQLLRRNLLIDFSDFKAREILIEMFSSPL